MDIEYEATFPNIDKDAMRARLRAAGATCVQPEFLQRRVVFHLPEGHEIRGGWLRVRDEGERVTMSLKVIDGDRIDQQREHCIVVDDFERAAAFLEDLGCVRKAYQETKRERWMLDGVEVCIDEWPWLEPLVEIEGPSEAAVRATSERLGFAWNDARFCHAGTLYAERYGFPESHFNDHSPVVVFAGANPFIHHA